MNSRTQGANSLEELITPLEVLERGFRDWWAEKGIGRGLLQDSLREVAHQAWITSRERAPVRTPEVLSPCAAVPFLRLAILREVLGAATLTDYNLGKWLREEIEKEEKRGETS